MQSEPVEEVLGIRWDYNVGKGMKENMISRALIQMKI